MNCNTTHYRANSSSVPGDPTSLKAVLVSGAGELLPSGPASGVGAGKLGDVPVLPLAAALADAAETPMRTPVALDDVALLQYTGGTTGRPRGAQLTHRNVLVNNLQLDAFTRYRLGEETIASAFPMFHVGGAAVTFNALRSAATSLVVPDPRDVERFCSEMRAHPPTVLIAVPALFQMLLDCPTFRALDFRPLRLAISAAAPFSSDAIHRLEGVIGQGKVCEVFGMTETSPIQTCNPPTRFRVGFVGVPVPGTDLRIVDVETGQREVPPASPGEIIVRGPQVMKGYLNSADGEGLRQFEGQTWMYTGDVGLMDEEGYVKLCDRSKDMLIVGGYKVFSVEVESKLQALPFVALCAVVGRPDEARPGNDVAQLYVQLEAGAGGTEEECRQAILAFCRANLAPYKVPKEITFVEAIPLTSVGKIDKKALRGRRG